MNEDLDDLDVCSTFSLCCADEGAECSEWVAEGESAQRSQADFFKLVCTDECVEIKVCVGLLPLGLTDDERMKIKMSVPPSPSAALMKERSVKIRI